MTRGAMPVEDEAVGVQTTDPITIEVEDVTARTEANRGDGGATFVDHTNKCVVVAVVRLLSRILEDRGRSGCVDDDQEFTAGVNTDCRTFIERSGECRRTRSSRGPGVNAEE